VHIDLTQFLEKEKELDQEYQKYFLAFRYLKIQFKTKPMFLI
jgi:hypothetical protein